ncbi:hypothetical protein [Acinetobacter radioresistens]|uniref:hypothetical protein n=1 Tax=Acinetobacter radioresistens TaxID=40216 RepID=UPI0021CDBB85|nr:hypothetical protein [Acinetobacter radioresistens]MCU4309802.1 hypothetical protein [Acinetobacter radioresistens]MCU4567489.1 hypothetical protein [Acinetobacter radioresistens]
MQLQKFNTGTANVRHLLQSFTQAYDGLPSCVINVIGVATKADPQFIFNIELDVVLFHQHKSQAYCIEVNAPLQVQAIADAHESFRFNPDDSHALIEGEVMDVAINLQRQAINDMIQYDLLSDAELEKFNTWNKGFASALLTECFEDVADFNALHSSHFMANTVYLRLIEYFKNNLS